MKIALVYYSYTGHVQHFVDELQKQLDVDIYHVEQIHTLHGCNLFKYFIKALFSASNRYMAIQPFEFDSQQYDHVIIATPVWNGHLPPGMNTFFKSYTLDCNLSIVLSCFVKFDYIIDRIKERKIHGCGHLTDFYTIYDRKPESVDVVIHDLKFNLSHINLTEEDIHLDSLY